MMIDYPRIKNTIVPNFSVDDSVNKGWKVKKKVGSSEKKIHYRFHNNILVHLP